MAKKSRFIKNVLLLSVIWGVIMFAFLSRSYFTSRSAIELEFEEAMGQLNETLVSLEVSKNLNAELEEMIKDYIRNTSSYTEHNEELLNEISNKIQSLASELSTQEFEPELEYEMLRRRIFHNIQEMSNYVEHNILTAAIASKNPEIQKKADLFLELSLEHKRSLLNDVDDLTENDGYDKWRQLEHERLTDLVQRRIDFLQNPTDCSTARKLICPYRYCGFGCQIHHWINCLTYAYGTQRVMVIKPKEWNYHHGGFEEIFMPVSRTCDWDDSNSTLQWPAPDEVQVVTLNTTFFGFWNISRPAYMPSAIPEDLEPRISKLHGHPPSWWVAQFVRYLFRLQPEYKAEIEHKIKTMGFKTPAVAIHVRRTDKVVSREGGLHSIHEYMKPAIEYFKRLEMKQKIDKRRVYLATDDPNVIKEARYYYPDIQIFNNEGGAKVANYSTRYSDSGFQGILFDLHVLSRCDYIICTFSSHICRLSYELIQSRNPDAANRFHSLETLWHTHEASPGFLETIIPHHPTNNEELTAEKGDMLEMWLWHNFSHGYVSAQNLRTKQHGQIPSFKVIDKWEITKFPTYPEV